MTDLMTRPGHGSSTRTDADDLVAPARQLRWWRELLLIGAWYGGYESVRAASPTQVGAAQAHAQRLLGFERWTHLDPERALNRLASASSQLGALAGYYYATLHFAVTVSVLVWLYRRRRALYRRARTVLITASAASLLAFWFFPVAPPRLAMHGLDDVVVTHNVLGAGHAASSGTFVDLYAALPSLHVGWAFWVALALVRAHAASRYRHLAWLYPTATAFVVLATANHYLIDAAAGVTVIVLAELAYLLLARSAASFSTRRALPPRISSTSRSPKPPSSSAAVSLGRSVSPPNPAITPGTPFMSVPSARCSGPTVSAMCRACATSSGMSRTPVRRAR
jgi:hypothetical protein